MEEERFGHLEIKLNEQLQQKGLSKNKLSHKAEMNWKQIDNYCKNNIARLDVYVLCKLCTVLECRIEDLLEFHPFIEHTDTQKNK
ncbi:MAG: helix-turn-helix transcriptional regulator [Hungatella sp.]|nr:helix-turn-helix transcriptional regulator [Hungatella sp.]